MIVNETNINNFFNSLKSKLSNEYYKGFNDKISNGNITYYEVEKSISQEEKTLMLRDINLEILENGTSDKLEQRILEIELKNVHEGQMGTISPVLKSKNIQMKRLSISLSNYMGLNDVNMNDFINQIILNLNTEFNKLLDKIPVYNLDIKSTIYKIHEYKSKIIDNITYSNIHNIDFIDNYFNLKSLINYENCGFLGKYDLLLAGKFKLIFKIEDVELSQNVDMSSMILINYYIDIINPQDCVLININ